MMFNFHFLTHFKYYPLKMWLLEKTGLPHPVLHIYLGLMIQLSICLMLRKRISHPTPLFFVYFAELYNEIHDSINAGDMHEIDRAFALSTGFDFLNTIIIPTTLFLLARYTNMLGRDIDQT